MNAMVIDALKRRPEILEVTDTLRSIQFGVNAAKSTNAPSIAGTIGIGTRGTNFPPSSDSFSIGVSVNWNPFDGGYTGGRLREAKAMFAIASANKKSAELQVVSDVAHAYTEMKNAEQRVVSSINSVTNAQEGLRIALGRFSSGLGQFIDIIDAETALESAQSDQTLAQQNVDLSRSELAHATGAPLP